MGKRQAVKNPIKITLKIVGMLGSLASVIALIVSLVSAGPQDQKKSSPIANNTAMDNNSGIQIGGNNSNSGIQSGETKFYGPVNIYNRELPQQKTPEQKDRTFYYKRKSFLLNTDDNSRFISPYISEKIIGSGIHKTDNSKSRVIVNLKTVIEDKRYLHEEYMTRIKTTISVENKEEVLLTRSFDGIGSSYDNYELSMKNASYMILEKIKNHSLIYDTVKKINEQYAYNAR